MGRGKPLTLAQREEEAWSTYQRKLAELKRKGEGSFSTPYKGDVPYKDVKSAVKEVYNRKPFSWQNAPQEAFRDEVQIDPNDPRNRHRNRFLEAIETIAPEVIKHLYSIMLEPEKGLGNFTSIDQTWQNKRVEKLQEVHNKFPHVLPSQTRSLLAWLREYHLEVDWMLERVTATWDAWRLEDLEGSLDTSRLKFAKYETNMLQAKWTYPPPPQFTLTHQADLSSSWEVEEAYLRWRFERELMNFHGLRQSLGTSQYVSEKTSYDHFEWLVHYQIKNASHSDILKNYAYNQARQDLSPSTISRGLHSTSEAIGLTLKPSAKGKRPSNP